MVGRLTIEIMESWKFLLSGYVATGQGSLSMSKDLKILQLQDDLEQAGKEIQHLQKINENLMNDQNAHNAAMSRISVENNSLRFERDELRNVIQLADDGIADINTHWKQKFFMWRETESQLMKELSQSKDKIHDLSSDYEAKIQKQLKEYEKLKLVIDSSRDENEKLSQSLAKVDDEMKTLNRKLMEESRKNVQNMFLSRENEILGEKVSVLEAKVHSFYEESIQHSRELNQLEVRQEAERDFNVTHQQGEVSKLNIQVTALKKELKDRESEVKHCQDEISRLSCLCESQASKIKQIRKQYESSNESNAESAMIIQKEREKLKKASEVIDDLDEKVKAVQKVNDELKAENDLKFELAREKDAQIQHHKSCYLELEAKFNGLITEVDDYKHTLNLAENEKIVVNREMNSWISKHDSMKDCLDKVSSENIKLVEELENCNSKITVLSSQCKDAEIENSCTDRALVDCQQKLADFEVELADKISEIEDLRTENALINDKVMVMIEEKGNDTETINRKALEYEELVKAFESLERKSSSEVTALKDEIASKETIHHEYKMEMEEKVNKLINLTEYSDKSTSNISLNSTILVNCGTMTEPEVATTSDSHNLRKQISALKKAIANKERKLCHSETELAKQASTIVQKQCRIDQLNMKYVSRCSQNEQARDDENNLVAEIKTLNEKVNSLNNVINCKNEELDELRAAESEMKKREQTFWELSELVNILQNDLDSKHTNTLREVNFYKNRLMEYERRTPSVNKSVNTSLQEVEECSEVESDMISCKSGELGGKSFDLKDLENVMNNLKSDYKHDLDAIHASFREKLSEIGDYSDYNEFKWIDLMNK